jgi:hypothetical protein
MLEVELIRAFVEPLNDSGLTYMVTGSTLTPGRF